MEEEDLCSDQPLLLGGSGWIADAIVTKISGLSASIKSSSVLISSQY